MVVWETNRQLGPEMWDRNEVAMGNFLDWRSRNQVFDQLGALFYTDMNLTGIGSPERIKSCVVTSNLFQVLGVQPMRSLLFEVMPTDWLTFVTASIVLLTVALLACYIPARRATKLHPLVALRYE